MACIIIYICPQILPSLVYSPSSLSVTPVPLPTMAVIYDPPKSPLPAIFEQVAIVNAYNNMDSPRRRILLQPVPVVRISMNLPFLRSHTCCFNLLQAIPPPQRPHSHQMYTTSKSDLSYGHRYMARLCARFITNLFTCPDYPQSSTPQEELPFFIARVLDLTKLHHSIIFAALLLLQRRRDRFPTAHVSSGHHLFISALIVAVKITRDYTFFNGLWSIVAHGMFTPCEINNMECEMYSCLEPDLTIDINILADFEKMVKLNFGGGGPYLTTGVNPVPSFGHYRSISASAHARPPPVTPSACTCGKFDNLNGKRRYDSLPFPTSFLSF
jgi:hypothetical protein